MYNWKTVLLTLGVLVGLKIWSPYLVDNIKWSYFDVLHQQKESQLIDNIVLVDIDEKSLKEIYRVLKPKGLLIFREPLGANPFFQIYRKFTPNARTLTERPFTIGDIKIMKKYFIIKEIQWFGFLSIISAFFNSYFLMRFLTSIDYLLSKTFIKIFYSNLAM